MVIILNKISFILLSVWVTYLSILMIFIFFKKTTYFKKLAIFSFDKADSILIWVVSSGLLVLNYCQLDSTELSFSSFMCVSIVVCAIVVFVVYYFIQFIKAVRNLFPES